MHAASCTSSLCWKFRTTATSGTPCALRSLRNFLIKTPLSTRSEIPSSSFKFCRLNLSASLPAQYPEKGTQQFSAPSPFAAVKVTSYLALIPRLLHQNGSVATQALVAQRRDFGQQDSPRVAAGASGRLLAESGFPALQPAHRVESAARQFDIANAPGCGQSASILRTAPARVE